MNFCLLKKEKLTEPCGHGHPGYGLANIYEVAGVNSEPTCYPLARVGSVSLGQLEIVGSGR